LLKNLKDFCCLKPNPYEKLLFGFIDLYATFYIINLCLGSKQEKDLTRKLVQHLMQ